MKKFIFIIAIFASIAASGQILRPAKWSFNLVENKNGEAELSFNVKMDKDWHIYSQYTPDGGPLPMLFTFDASECYSLIDKVTEPKPIEQYDSLFEIKVFFLEKEAMLKQKVKLSGKDCTIKGRIDYQACKDVCIALDTTFVFTIGKGKLK